MVRYMLGEGACADCGGVVRTVEEARRHENGRACAERADLDLEPAITVVWHCDGTGRYPEAAAAIDAPGVVHAATMAKAGPRPGSGRPERELVTGEPQGTARVNRAIPMTAGEWVLVQALARDAGQPAAAFVRDLLLDIATGKARIVRDAE